MYGQSNSNSALSYIKIENENITVTQNGIYEASGDYSGLGKVTVDVPGVNNQEKFITPTRSQQIIEPSQGYTGLSRVTVYGVENVEPSNIKAGVKILDVTGNYEGTPIRNQDKTVTTNGEVTADEGYTGLGTVTVNVTGSNPKYGATIDDIFGNVDANGVLQQPDPQETFTFVLPNNAVDVNDYALANKFHYCTNITSADLSSLNAMSGDYALSWAFGYSTGLTNINLSSLTTVSGDGALSYTFLGCTGLTSIDLSSLTTISGVEALSYIFAYCTNLTDVDLSSLTTVAGDEACAGAFINSSLTSVDLSSLTTVSEGGVLNGMFLGCHYLTSVDLSSLTTVSGTGALSNIFKDCINLTDIDLSSLTTISGTRVFSNTFRGCQSLSEVNFTSLQNISSSDEAFYKTFEGCTALTDVRFPALNTFSFDNVSLDIFDNMLYDTGTSVTHTLHFPSNIQSIIAGLDGYPLFGGTSGYVTLAFDLPATS